MLNLLAPNINSLDSKKHGGTFQENKNTGICTNEELEVQFLLQ